MSSSINGINYEELEDSPEMHIDDTGLVGTRTFRIAWSDSLAFIDSVMGHFDTSGNPEHSGTPLSFPGWDMARVVDVDLKPFQGKSPDDMASADLMTGSVTTSYAGGARVVVRYASLYPPDPPTAHKDLSMTLPAGTFLTYEREFGGEIMTAPSGQLYWVSFSSGDKLESDNVHPGIIIPSTQHVITWFWVMDPPWDNIRKAVGAVNSATFLGAPAGNVLFLGCQPVQVPRNQRGEILYKLIYRFAEQSKLLRDGSTAVGWNYLWRPATSGERWISVVDQDDDPLYPSKDFASTLFVQVP